jgi:rare lipoprotein A
MKLITWFLILPGLIYSQTMAKSYEDRLHGSQTINGEFYDLDALTGSHSHFKLGSWVRLSTKNQKKSVIIRINDCSDQLGDTIVISRSAAEILDFMPEDIEEIELELVKEGTMTNPCKFIYYTIQLASFSNPENAKLLLDSLQIKGMHNILILEKLPNYKVVIGKFSKRQDAEIFRDLLKQDFDLTGFITLID